MSEPRSAGPTEIDHPALENEISAAFDRIRAEPLGGRPPGQGTREGRDRRAKHANRDAFLVMEHERRKLAERLRTPLFEPGGALSDLSPETQDHLHDEAKRLAAVFQRSSANVEGRNGSLSLRSHQLRGLDLPRKRECCTAMHNFFLTRPDGTTAAERFFGQKPRSMFAAILASVELAPAPLNPPRLP